MILAVNPTRMELLKLKRRISIARRGHKLLKDKQDELMRKFLAMIDTARSLRSEVEGALKGIFECFTRARSLSPEGFIDVQLGGRKSPLEVAAKKDRFLNLELLRFEIVKLVELPQYGFFATTSDLDLAVVNFRKILPKMIELAEVDIRIKLLAEEIKTTRRRVNALEYIFIPGLVDTVKYINMKLTELERSNFVRLMRVKELLEAR
ncbi:MAG: V-type ATP synthase subunit D [Candidatus Omnitrophica bacterium]|nr:V-type ATP synthase subunit D [Candidatus Omnitrophota bacterium]